MRRVSHTYPPATLPSYLDSIFLRADPDNRLVAAELEQRWEAALRAVQAAEAANESGPDAATLVPLPEELRAAFTDLGRRLPALWASGVFTRAQQKALLRCLIDKVVVHRVARDRVQARIVWRGGATTTRELAVTVGAFADLTGAAEMERLILERTAAGDTDEAIAADLTRRGHRSPLRAVVLPSTVKAIRLRHRQLRSHSQSHPRRVDGCLTVPQLAQALGVTPHWLYDRIYNGSLPATKDSATGLYLFPDDPATLERLRALLADNDGRPGA